MIRQFTKKSQYRAITLTNGTTSTLPVEGDEIYLFTDGQAGVVVQTERIMAMAACALAAGVTLPVNTMLTTTPLLLSSAGRVPLDAPTDNSGWLSNQAAINANQPERLRSELCGIKETIFLTPNGLPATPPGRTMIVFVESVHYVPVDEIAA